MTAETVNNKTLKTRDLTLIALFAALIAICAWITVPMPDVPFTMQVFGIFMALLLLGGRRGTWSILLYLLLGAVGLPVFSGFRGGMGALLSVTGGYLMGFAFSGLVYWAITAAVKKDSLIVQVCSLLAALFVCYTFGTLWFVLVYLHGGSTVSVGLVLMKCVVPYLIPDFAKLALSVTIAKAVKKHAMH